MIDKVDAVIEKMILIRLQHLKPDEHLTRSILLMKEADFPSQNQYAEPADIRPLERLKLRPEYAPPYESEKYDFIIDPQQEDSKITLVLQSEFLKICSQIEKLGGELLKNKLSKNASKDSWDQFNLEVENLSKVCSKINLHLQKLADASKMLIRNIFDSLNAQLQ